jgi:nucleoside-diphosphate-sugar epimerase
VEFDTGKALELLGFRADVDVPTGISRTAMWYRQNGFL